MNLGLVAGGIAKGYNDAEELKLKKLAAAREDARFSRERQGWDREDTARQVIQSAPVVGESVPVNYDPATRAEDAAKPVGLPTPDQHAPGAFARMTGGIARALGLGTEPAAIASGVKPPPTGIPTPGAAPAGDPNATTVQAPTAKRPATEEDVARYNVHAAKLSGDQNAFHASMEELMKVTNNNNIKLIAGAPIDQLGDIIGDALGKDVTVAKNKAGKIDVTVDGKPYGTFDDDKALRANLTTIVDRDPRTALTFAAGMNKDVREATLAASTVASNAAHARAALTSASAAASNAATNARGEARAQQLQNLGIEDRNALKQAYDVLAQPDIAILNPTEAARAATVIQRLDPHDVRSVTMVDDKNNRTTAPVSAAQYQLEQQQKAFGSNPYGIVVRTAGGKPFFVVPGDVPGKGYTTQLEANRAARMIAAKQGKK